MKLKRRAPEDLQPMAPTDLVERLVRLYGEPWDMDDKGLVVRLNPDWWAGLIHAESHLLHDPEEERFYQWDELEGIYLPESKFRVALAISLRLLRASREISRPELNDFRSLRSRETIRTILRSISEVRDPFHHKRPILALNDGVVELLDGQIHFRRFDPKYLLCHKANVCYDPKATCPRFLKEFLKPMLSEDDVDLLQRYLGLVLIGMNLMNRMGILEGDSAAGKTTLVNIMVALLGEGRCCQLRTEHLDKQFELEAFRGRQLLLGVDVGSTFLNSVGAQTLKGLCSTDLYHPEAKGRSDRRPLRGPFHVLIATNCKLTYHSQGDGAAWARRLLIFDCKTPEKRRKIPNFDVVLLRKEGPGIVNWLLEGLRKALQEIEAWGDLLMTDVQLDRINQLVMRSEAAEVFVQRCLVADQDEDVTSEEVIEAFYAFCTARGWQPGSDRDFLGKMSVLIGDRFGRPKSNDLVRDGKKARRGWHGLKLVDEGWRPSDDPF